MNREDWNTINFDKKYVKGTVKKLENKLEITGSIKVDTPNTYVTYWAADPSENHQSFFGSQLPFPSKFMAFSRRKNMGQVKIENKQFKFIIEMPNAFYKALGTYYVPPMVNIRLCESTSEYDSIQLSNGFPYKYLNHPAIITPGANIKKQYKPSVPLFYTNRNFELRGQEQILRESGVPEFNKMPANYWGKKPSV